jgi:hypothetical protein
MTLESGMPPITNLSGPVVDQAKLRGIMNKLWDLNLAVISVKRIEAQKSFQNMLAERSEASLLNPERDSSVASLPQKTSSANCSFQDD